MKSVIYYDNASTSYPKFKKFYEDTMRIYEECGVNFSRNYSEKSKNARIIKEKLIQNLQEIFSTKNEIILNSSATFSLNEVISGLDYSKIKTVYISPFEHNSSYRVIKRIAREKNLNLKILKFNKFELDYDDMKAQFLINKPDLVICNHASNVFGNVLPVEKIFKEAKIYNAITILDATQTGGVLDFKEISPFSDFIIFAGHKNLYGPSGIGGYIYNREVFLEPLLYGGTGIKSEDEDMPDELPERFEAGSPNILGIIGLEISSGELLKVGIKNIEKRKKENIQKLYDVLKEYSYDLNILSDRENNVGIISITGNDYSPLELESMLNSEGVVVRRGLHCAPLAHKHMDTIGEGGTIRISVGYFNSDEDLKNFNEILEGMF